MKSIINIIADLAYNQEMHSQKLSEEQIIVEVPSKYTKLKTVFDSSDNNSYEHHTVVCNVPPEKRGEIAEAAISDAYREITPFMPRGDDRLMLYGSRTDLHGQSERQIRDHLLDDFGRIQAFDNEKRPVLNHILSKSPKLFK